MSTAAKHCVIAGLGKLVVTKEMVHLGARTKKKNSEYDQRDVFLSIKVLSIELSPNSKCTICKAFHGFCLAWLSCLLMAVMFKARANFHCNTDCLVLDSKVKCDSKISISVCY